MSIKHILFSVAGMSPAIITETLFGLKTQGVVGGEIHLLTTSFGKKSMQVLLGDSGQVAAFNRMYKTNWLISPEWIETLVGDDRQPLEDLRSSVDNETAANAIVEKVRFWTEQDDVVLHASVAGGRKTMGIYLTQAMSWFARPDDDLSHVLVAEEFERNRDFYFPVIGVSSHESIVDFAEVPFVRMRYLLPPLLMKVDSYSQRVELSELYLRDINKTGILSFHVRNRTLSLDNFKLVKLQPLNAALYLFLLENANLANEQEPFYFDKAFDYCEALSGCLIRVGLKHSKSGLSSLALPRDKWASNWQNLGSRDEIDNRKSDLESAFGKLNKDFKEVWKNASFLVFNCKDKKSNKGSCRWVDIAPDRVKVIED
jgi:CRISPR-associated protein (TIGR02584 family)